jgi:L-threonylcarbamoyladenylate synthase
MFNTIIGTDISVAGNWLKQDELVAIPTETVYGLAANACSESAIQKVFATKNRPSYNPLIVHVDNVEKISKYVKSFPDIAESMLMEFSPGPLTILLPTNGILPSIVNNGKELIAFRIPDHVMTLELLASLEFPLVAPSANLYTTVSPTDPQHVLKNFQGLIPYILDGGPCNVGIESTVVGFDKQDRPIIYRQGAITENEIRSFAGYAAIFNKEGDHSSPGLSKLHYSPSTKLVLITDLESLPEGIDPDKTGLISFSAEHPLIPRTNTFVLSPNGDMKEAARNLYKALHHLDDLSLELILAQRMPLNDLGVAINDRLTRAANK